MTDCLVIRQLAVKTVIGVYGFERASAQTLRIDATLHLSPRSRLAATSDQLSDTLDYAAVVKRLGETASAADYQLLEALGEALCAVVLREFNCPQVDLVLYKDGCIPGAIGAEYHLSRHSD